MSGFTGFEGYLSNQRLRNEIAILTFARKDLLAEMEYESSPLRPSRYTIGRKAPLEEIEGEPTASPD